MKINLMRARTYHNAIYLASLLTLALVTTAWGWSFPESLSIRSRLLGAEAIDRNASHFTISPDGTIENGPRRAPDEKVDVSSLLSDDALKDVFQQAIFGCFEGVHHCDRHNVRLPIERIYLEFSGSDNIPHRVVSEISSKIIAAATFLEIPMASSPLNASTIKFMVVDDKDALTAAKQTGDTYAVDFFARSEKGDQAYEKYVAIHGSCYVSTKDFSKGKVTIIIPFSGVQDCYMLSFLRGLGLSNTAGFFPSATGSDRVYRFPTLADRFFIKALYSPEFPPALDLVADQQFFEGYLRENRSQLNEE